MNILHNMELSSESRRVLHLAFGFFDGVHAGHRAVIEAGSATEPTARGVFTLEPHPVALFQPEKKPKLITGLPHKLEILCRLGLGAALVLPFDAPRALQEPEAFLNEIGDGFPNLHSISCGADWTFGHQRRGDVTMLRKWAAERDIALYVPAYVTHAGREIRSSWIRQAIETGDLDLTQALLGRSYGIYGEITQGSGRGREIGFPTINLQTLDECLPPLGVYAGFTQLQDGPVHLSAINIGRRPTLHHGQTLCIEAHLLEFTNQDLYGQMAEIHPTQWLRAEERFDSAEKLRQAIAQDVSQIQGLKDSLQARFQNGRSV